MKNVSIRKILQVLYYIQSHAPEGAKKNDIMYFLKIVFFAVRYHLRNYGTPYMNIQFYAMKNGPVASEVKDVLEHKLPLNADAAETQLLNEIEAVGDYDYEIKAQDADELSPSFVEALDFALEKFGKYKPFELSDISHCYPEWKKQENNLSTVKRRVMRYEDFFEDPQNLTIITTDPFADDREFLDSLKQDFCVQNAISC